MILVLCQSGAVWNRSFQPYEAHIPYLLQVKIDLNLYGMGPVHASHVHFRGELPPARPRRALRWWESPPALQYEDGTAGVASNEKRLCQMAYLCLSPWALVCYCGVNIVKG